MRNEIITRLHLLAGAVLLALTAIGFVKIPPGPGLAMHWGPDGHPDLLWPRNWALLLFPVLGALLLLWGFAMDRFVPPEESKSPEQRRELSTFVLIGLGLLAALQFGFILIGIGSDIDLFRILGFVAAIAMVLWGAMGLGGGDTYALRQMPGADSRIAARLLRALFVIAGLGLFWAALSWTDPVDTLPALGAAVLLPPILASLFRLVRRPGRS